MSYVSYLRDVKRGRNPSRKHGCFGLHVSLKLFFSEILRIFLGKVSPWCSFSRVLKLRFVCPMYLCSHSPLEISKTTPRHLLTGTIFFLKVGLCLV